MSSRDRNAPDNASRSDPYHGAINQTFSADVAAAQVGARQWRASATIATSPIAFSSRAFRMQ